MSKNKYIARQPYFKVIRQLSSIEQKEIKDERNIYLYIDKIVTERREFPLKDVFDLSFRKIGTEGGILFIHTNHGVYSYTVTSSPLSFIHTCKSYLM